MSAVWRRRRYLPLGAAVVLAACGDGGNSAPALPSLPVQASSAHFRYHAASADLIPAGTLDALEANRADVFSYLGLGNDNVVDYYLFPDAAAVEATGICPSGTDCALGSAVIASAPVHPHELIHAYLATVGAPPSFLQEGAATAISCEQVWEVGPVFSDWRELLTSTRDLSGDFYDTAMRFTRFLIVQYGPARFLDYYRQARDTADATTFARDFQAYWSRSIDDVWSAAQISPAPTQPLCPCGAASITPDSEPQQIAHAFGSDYRPLAVPARAALTIAVPPVTSGTFADIEISDCARSSPPTMLLSGDDTKGSMNLMKLDAAPSYVMFESAGVDELTLTEGASLDSDCAHAGTVSLDQLSAMSVIVPAGGAASFVHLSAPSPATLLRVGQLAGDVRLCSDCSLSDCRPVPPVSVAAPDGSILEIDPSTIPGPGLSSFLLQIRGSAEP